MWTNAGICRKAVITKPNLKETRTFGFQMIPELNNFKCQLVIYCTVDCTLAEQVYFKFGTQSCSWGPVLKQ